MGKNSNDKSNFNECAQIKGCINLKQSSKTQKYNVMASYVQNISLW